MTKVKWQKVFIHHPRSHRGRWFGEILSGHPAQTSSWCHRSGSTVCCSKLYGQIERFRRRFICSAHSHMSPKGKQGQLPEGADLEADVVHEYVERLEMMVPFEGQRAGPSGQHEPSPQLPEDDDLAMRGIRSCCRAGGQGGDCGLRPMSGLHSRTTQSYRFVGNGRRGSRFMCGTKEGGKPIDLAGALPQERTLSGNVYTLTGR
ncbi:hypothetical protein GEV33_003744 [Tenebrio molitor]|uniref:Uncharacterized protein n=1 Tax=Tenebrio molitor TaxID=7067 RepID=A0A8J6HR09_TENMO|nr:hypothetical protein GEV33_003744 [Tenebrio molitor]